MTLKEALIAQGHSEQVALDIIDDMRYQVHIAGENPEDVLDMEGLEPDYIFDLLEH